VDIPHLVNVQVQEMEAVLKRALEEISEAERAHRERFTGQRLEMTFAGLSHPMEKMHQAVREETFRPVGMYGVEAVQRSLYVFKERLAERGEPFREDLELIYGQLNAALSRLTEFYNRRQDDLTSCATGRAHWMRITSRPRRILTWLRRQRLLRLCRVHQMAKTLRSSARCSRHRQGAPLTVAPVVAKLYGVRWVGQGRDEHVLERRRGINTVRNGCCRFNTTLRTKSTENVKSDRTGSSPNSERSANKMFNVVFDWLGAASMSAWM
jgi:hypothetical protein